MKCDLVQDNLVRFVLGELLEDEDQRIADHLSLPCIVCQAHLDEIQASVDLLFEGVPNAPICDEEVAKIRMAATGLAESESKTMNLREGPIVLQKRESRHSIALYATAFAAGLFLTATLLPLALRGGSEETSVNPIRSLETYGNPSTTTNFMSLKTESASPLIQGQTLYDHINGELHYYGRNFPEAPAGCCFGLATVDLNDIHTLQSKLLVDLDGKSKMVIKLPSIVNVRAISIEVIPDDLAVGSPVTETQFEPAI